MECLGSEELKKPEFPHSHTLCLISHRSILQSFDIESENKDQAEVEVKAKEESKEKKEDKEKDN